MKRSRFRLDPFAGGAVIKCGRPECFRLSDTLLVDVDQDLGVMPYCRRDGELELEARR
jgi:hypothetical protein